MSLIFVLCFEFQCRRLCIWREKGRDASRSLRAVIKRRQGLNYLTTWYTRADLSCYKTLASLQPLATAATTPVSSYRCPLLVPLPLLFCYRYAYFQYCVFLPLFHLLSLYFPASFCAFCNEISSWIKFQFYITNVVYAGRCECWQNSIILVQRIKKYFADYLSFYIVYLSLVFIFQRKELNCDHLYLLTTK